MRTVLWLLRAAAAPALCALGWWLGVVHGPWPWVASAAMAVLAFGALAGARTTTVVCFIGLGAMLLALGFGLVPGFSRLALGPSSVNTAKALAGLGAALMFPSPLRWNARCTLVAVVTLVGVPLVAWAVGYVHWAPAALKTVGVFAIANLFTVIGEEWFFRRWIQQPLQPEVGAALALATSAVLFGLAHFAGGLHFMLLAALAGLGYGGVFLAGGSIWAAVILHWVLNVLRVALFGVA
jgi:membrane protease YdiL (CAAX protease family)